MIDPDHVRDVDLDQDHVTESDHVDEVEVQSITEDQIKEGDHVTEHGAHLRTLIGMYPRDTHRLRTDQCHPAKSRI